MQPHEPTTHWPKNRPYYKPPKKNWRLKRGAVPAWYKQRNGVRTHAQSGAARVARFRPRRAAGARFERDRGLSPFFLDSLRWPTKKTSSRAPSSLSSRI